MYVKSYRDDGSKVFPFLPGPKLEAFLTEASEIDFSYSDGDRTVPISKYIPAAE